MRPAKWAPHPTRSFIAASGGIPSSPFYHDPDLAFPHWLLIANLRLPHALPPLRARRLRRPLRHRRNLLPASPALHAPLHATAHRLARLRHLDRRTKQHHGRFRHSRMVPADHAAVVAYIATIEVLPMFRRQGIGAELLRRLEGSANAERAIAIWLHVDMENAAAIRLYERAWLRQQRSRRTLSTPATAPPPST